MTNSRIEKLMSIFNAYALKRSEELGKEFGRSVDPDHIRVAVYTHIIETMLSWQDEHEDFVLKQFDYIIREVNHE